MPMTIVLLQLNNLVPDTRYDVVVSCCPSSQQNCIYGARKPGIFYTSMSGKCPIYDK